MIKAHGKHRLADMIIVTGAAGFIGSQIANHLAQKDPTQLILVDKLDLFRQRNYTPRLNDVRHVEAGTFLAQLPEIKDLNLVVHMGAITNTAEKDISELERWNVEYTKAIWDYCTQNGVPLIYASSAATYGNGQNGFSDDHALLANLKPLNLYGKSKNDFDLYAISRPRCPPFWYGLKFFNVYGPNEIHKGRMASAIWHGFQEIQTTGAMTLFRSHNPDFKDGEQARDFIFIKDVLNIISFLRAKKPASGIYNCGTGRAETFASLASHLFGALKKSEKINWVDTPAEFRAGYQYKTQAVMDKLRKAGYERAPTSLAEGVRDYVYNLLGSAPGLS